MTMIKEGNTYTAVARRNGPDWEFITVKDEKGQNEIMIYVSNYPSTVKANSRFTIRRLERFTFGQKKDAQGVWHPAVRVYATVEPISDPSREII